MLYLKGYLILENKEFEKWCKQSYSKILTWFDKIIEREKEKLVTEGLITVEEITNMKVFKSKQYTATKGLKEEAIQLEGLKKYLKAMHMKCLDLNICRYF